MPSLRSGNHEDLSRLYVALGPPALSKILRLIGKRSVADELLQDVFLRLWQADIIFENEKSAFTWVYKSCHNAAIDYLRSAVHKREAVLADQDFLLPSGDDFSLRTEDRQIVFRALRHLDQRELAIFLYSEADGMTQDEIAEVLDVTRKTIVRSMASINAKLALLRG